jgi:hypothetical protein
MKIIINLGREILLLGSVRESIMTPSETSSEKKCFSNVRKILHCTAALIKLKCDFIVMASNELTSVREVIISAEGVREVIISAGQRL